MKVCRTCRKEKKLTGFYKNKNCKDGHLNSCKRCQHIETKRRYWVDPEAARERSRKRWRELNPGARQYKRRLYRLDPGTPEEAVIKMKPKKVKSMKGVAMSSGGRKGYAKTKSVQIKEPMWNGGYPKIGIAEDIINSSDRVLVEILYRDANGKLTFPDMMIVDSKEAKTYPTMVVRGGRKLKMIPIKAMKEMEDGKREETNETADRSESAGVQSHQG